MDNQDLEKVVQEAKEKAKKVVDKKYSSDMLGYIHALEKEMKKILKEEYEIEWITTNERYSGDCID